MGELEEDEEDSLQNQTLALFDLLWFRRLILSNLPPPPPQVKPEEVLVHRRSIIHRRHHSSDDMTCSSPSLIIQPPKLQTILSAGKETESFETHVKKERRRWRRRRKKKTGESSSKSLSDLEVEELKGFMDLGFTFSDNAESDPRLREIVPGLQRLKMAAGTEEFQEATPTSGDDDVAEKVEVVRPYLSEAWEFEEEQIMLRGIMRIRMGGSEMDLKDQLRFWAQAVASTVW